MQEQSARMLNIIDDLLFLSRLETDTTAGKKELVNISELLKTIRNDALTYSGDKKHTVELSVQNSQYLKGDQKELYSAFSNLVINAIKYTPENGTIHMRWYNNTDGDAVFEVEDNGIGIPTQHIPRLTERFYRVDVGRSREQGGTGLGLAIVKHVMIRHNGRIEVSSEVNRGSLFRCIFPASLVEQTPAGIAHKP